MTETNQQPQNLGSKIDELKALRDQRANLAAQVEDLTKTMHGLESDIIAALDFQGMTQARATTASATITEQEVPIIEDWDAVYAFIQEHGAFYLLQQRASIKPFAELRASGTPVPGTDYFTKRSISLRKT